MARLRLIHPDEAEGRERQLRLAALGHQVDFAPIAGAPSLRPIRANPPDAVVIDLGRLPSHGREIGLTLRTYKDTRHVPLVFVDGAPAKVAALRALLPDATYTTWGRLKTALPRALAKKTRTPVAPPSSIYAARPLAQKLGIKPGMTVCVLNAPPGFARTLGELPAGASLTARLHPGCDLFLVFVRAARELAARLTTLDAFTSKQTLWLIWPKQAAKTRADVNGNTVRQAGLAAGWVDFKVCSVDETWSGLAFKKRR